MYANTNTSDMCGYLRKERDMWVVRYWRSISLLSPSHFSLPLHPDDVIELEIKQGRKTSDLEDLNVNFKIVPIPTIKGKIFVAKLKTITI